MFGLDNFSDYEEMSAGDSSQSSDSATHLTNNHHRARHHPTTDSPITITQLFAALSRAARRVGSNTSTGAPNSTSSGVSTETGSSNSNSGGIITYEMFDRAMQQAFATTPTSNPASNPMNQSMRSTPSGNNSAGATPGGQAPALQTQINVMHQMGLVNDAINIQALQLTNGHFQVAN